MDELGPLRKKITTAFKFSGFLIRSENSNFLAEQLSHFDAAERDRWLTIITENLQGQKLSTPHVERPALEKAINELNRVGLDEGETVFALIDAFSVPRFRYNTRIKKFERDTQPRRLLTQPGMKADYLRQRYALLLQKTLRHDLFAPAVIQDGVSHEAQVKKFKLQYAENLLATSSLKEAVLAWALAWT